MSEEVQRDEQLLDKLLKIAEVSAQVGLGKSAIYEMITAGKFPTPIKIGNASRWSQLETQAWIKSRKSNRASQT